MNTTAFRTTIVAAIGVLAAGTASAQSIRVTLPAWTEPVLLDTLRQEHQLSAAPGVVFAATRKTFAEFRIPVKHADSTVGTISSDKFETGRALAGAIMSRSFGCGETAIGPNADSYRLSIAIAVWVKPGKDGGSLLSVAAAASGRDPAGVYGHPRGCATTGWIEQKIATTVEKLLR